MAQNAPQSSRFASTDPLSAWGWTLSLTAGLLLLVLLGLRPHYSGIDEFGGNTDDPRAAMFASGAGVPGGPSGDLLYTNRLIGEALKILFTVWPDVPWYGFYLTGSHLVAQVLICFAWWRVTGDWRLRLSIVGFSFGMGSLLWIYLHFTTTCSLMAIAGVSLIASAVIEEAASERTGIFIGRVLGGWCCVAFAGLIRFHGLLVAGAILAPVMLLLAVLCWKRIALWKHAVIALVVTATICGLYAWSRHQLYAPPEWSAFKKIEIPAAFLINNRHATSLFFDHPTLSDETATALESVGWSHNDAKLLNYWLYFDEKVFSADALSKLESTLTKVSVSASMWLRAFYSVSRFFLVTPVCLLPMLLSAAILAADCRRVQTIGILIWCGTVMLCAAIHLYHNLPSQALFSIVSCAFFGTLIVSAHSAVLASRRGRFPNAASRGGDSGAPVRSFSSLGSRAAMVLLALAMGLAIYKTWDHFKEARRGVRYRAEFFSIVEKLDKGPENLYIVVLPFPFQRVSPFDTMQEWSDWQFIYTDGDLRSPRYHAFLREHGIDDLTEALYSDSRVKLITDEHKMKLLVEFLREHRGVETEYFVTRELDLFTVFQLRKKSSFFE